MKRILTTGDAIIDLDEVLAIYVEGLKIEVQTKDGHIFEVEMDRKVLLEDAVRIASKRISDGENHVDFEEIEIYLLNYEIEISQKKRNEREKRSYSMHKKNETYYTDPVTGRIYLYVRNDENPEKSYLLECDTGTWLNRATYETNRGSDVLIVQNFPMEKQEAYLRLTRVFKGILKNE